MPALPSIVAVDHGKLSHTETITVNVPLEAFHAWFFKAPLEILLPGTPKVPAVLGTTTVGGLSYPAEGSVRYVCLADGSGAYERVNSVKPERFSYVVWGYSLPAAQVIDYGHGQFEFTSAGDATALRWTYSFRLKDGKFPGFLGPIGRSLFRMSFLESQYVDFMKVGMQAIKAQAERQVR